MDKEMNMMFVENKAESLQYTSVGHRPTEYESQPSQALKGRNKCHSERSEESLKKTH